MLCSWQTAFPQRSTITKQVVSSSCTEPAVTRPAVPLLPWNTQGSPWVGLDTVPGSISLARSLAYSLEIRPWVGMSVWSGSAI